MANSIFAVTAAVAACLLAGCADMSGISPQAQVRDAASLGLSATVTAPAISAQWWRDFGDPQLDRLVDQALTGNPNLRIAQARLVRAQAVREVADSAVLPQVNGSLDLTRQRYTRNGAVPAPLAGSVKDSGTLQLSTSWEIDFFGKSSAAL